MDEATHDLETDTAAQRSPILNLIVAADDGALMGKLDDSLAEIITAGKGELTIKLAISRKGAGSIIFTPDYKEKIPREGCVSTSRYLGNDGEILRNDPAQSTLDFTGGPKVVGGEE